MAKRIIETFVDDIDGSEAEKTTTFALDGSTYEIDLSGPNRDKLSAILAPYITSGRAVRADRATRTRRRAGGGQAERDRSAEIRKWARAHNLPVSERGRISAGVVEQYDAAH